MSKSALPGYSAGEFFVFRAPLLSVDQWLALGDRATARERLRAIIARPPVREALFVASPSLEEALDIWTNAPESERGQRAEKSLVRYVARMCGRPTPFGLFAGVAVGDVVDGPTTLTLAGVETHRRHTRLDIDFLFSVCEALRDDSGLREHLVLRPSTSLYRVADRWRFVETRLGEARDRNYDLVSLETTPYLEAVLARAQAGATCRELVDAVALVSDATKDEAHDLILELVAMQLLVPALTPPVTGPEPIHTLIATLGDHPAAATLDEARATITAIDCEPLGVQPARYRALAERLRSLPSSAETPYLFQADLMLGAQDMHLGRSDVEAITRGVALLHRITPPRDALRDFRSAFLLRYESAEVPLAEVLDEEHGIGFERSTAPAADASPLLEGIALGEETVPKVEWGRREAWQLARACEGKRALVLGEADLEALAAKDPLPLPVSFAAVATLLDGPQRVLLHLVAGPSAANLLGRFCHGDERLLSLVRAHLAAEEAHDPDAIFAEVCHLPEGRVGNVLLRPLLRDYEIPFCGMSGAPRERQIAIDDLFVTVRGGRVVLRSRRLGRTVVPRLSTAHNYTSPRSLGVYRFLCALQTQGTASGLAWDWGPVASAPFLPRVVHESIVLERATWNIEAAQLKPLVEARGDDVRREASRLRDVLALPRFITIDDGDNRLPIDLDEVLSIETFAHAVRAMKSVRVSEILPEPAHQIATGPTGRFAHELVVPFSRTARDVHTTTSLPTRPTGPRRVVPGKEWLYLKLYGGVTALDDVLRRLAPEVRAALAAGHADGWFFVRYADPETHLRVRLHGLPDELARHVEPALLATSRALVDEGLLWRVQLDTYHRELERYGGDEGLALSERWFAADSDAALAITERIEGVEGADARWRLALYGIDRSLDVLGLSLAEKLALMSDVAAGFARQLGVDAAIDRQLGERFRTERAALEALLFAPAGAAHPLAPGLEILARRDERLRPLARQLRDAEVRGTLSVTLPLLATSLVHMCCNRMIHAAARAHELVLYDFLARLYRGQRARKK